MFKLILFKSEQDFANFRQSKSYQSEVLRLRVHFSVNQNFPRFGFIVPKKTMAKAIDRNLIKRRIKAVLIKYHGKLKPADFLFFPKTTALRVKFRDLESSICKLFTDTRLWK